MTTAPIYWSSSYKHVSHGVWQSKWSWYYSTVDKEQVPNEEQFDYHKRTEDIVYFYEICQFLQLSRLKKVHSISFPILPAANLLLLIKFWFLRKVLIVPHKRRSKRIPPNPANSDYKVLHRVGDYGGNRTTALRILDKDALKGPISNPQFGTALNPIVEVAHPKHPLGGFFNPAPIQTRGRAPGGISHDTAGTAIS